MTQDESTTTRLENEHPHKPAIILLSSTILMLVWWYYGSIEFYHEHLADRISSGHPEANAAYYRFFCCLFLLGIVPLLIVKFVLRENLSDYGLTLGNRLFTIRSFCLAAPLFVLAGYIGAQSVEMQQAFPINKQLGKSTSVWLHAVTFFTFYVGWEFHFRGYLQFGLADRFGRVNSVLIAVMASSVVHVGQPASESFGAIFGGIVWGWLAYRTNSIWSGMLQHFVLGMVVDMTIVYHITAMSG